jgi:hypothetical protein
MKPTLPLIHILPRRRGRTHQLQGNRMKARLHSTPEREFPVEFRMILDSEKIVIDV